MIELIQKPRSVAQKLWNDGLHAMSVARALKIKRKLEEINPVTGKRYSQAQIAKELGISRIRVVQLLASIRHKQDD